MNTAFANTARDFSAVEAGPGLLARVGSFFALLGAVHRVAAAVEGHRTPAAADLHLMGIDPAQMPTMHHSRV